jgi:oligopeptidase A
MARRSHPRPPTPTSRATACRPAEKRGGAWMAEVVGQSRLMAGPGETVRLPVAHMVCNQSPPVGDKPSLMTFREVETLFHEFGHALQHMLTDVEEGMVSGIRWGGGQQGPAVVW